MTFFLGWTLLHAAWQGGIIALGIAVALWLTRRDSARSRYFIALAGLALMLGAPIVTTIATTRPATPHSTGAALHIAKMPAAALPRAESGASAVAAGAANPIRRYDSPLSELMRGRIDSALPWLVAAWLMGVALLSVRVVAGVRKVRHLSRSGDLATDSRIRAAADRVAARLGITAAIRVLQSSEVDVPMVIGWLKPAVLIPASLVTGAVPAQLEMLLAHELAHIQRYDTIVNLAQTVVETLLFFHPAAWWISARVREERENCCDDLAIAACGSDRRSYGSMLLALEESRSTTALAMAVTDGSLLSRVRRIVLGPPTRVELGATWFAGVATMLMVLLVVAPGIARETTAASAVLAPSDLLTITPPISQAQPPSRSTPMVRSGLLATAAALTVAAANVSAQTPFNEQLSAGAVKSPVNGSIVSAVTGAALVRLLSGDSAGLAVVQRVLSDAGAPPVEAAALMTKLMGISRANRTATRAEVGTVVRAFNNMVNAAEKTPFATTPSPMFLGLHAVVANLSKAAQIEPLNVSGRWMLLTQLALTDSVSGVTVKADSPSNSTFTLNQTDRALTVTYDSAGGEAKLTFLIEKPGSPYTVRATGPTAINFFIHGVSIRFDAAGDTPKVGATWDGGTFDINLNKGSKGSMVLQTMTLSVNRAGHLVIETETPGAEGQPAKREVQRFRRA